MRFLSIGLIALVCYVNPGHAQSTAGLEFMAGFGGEIEADVENGAATQHDLSTTWAITPWLEMPLGKAAGIGPELNFIWIKGDSEEHERRLIVSPHLRIRLSFLIKSKVTFDSFLSMGPSWWTEDDESGAGVAGTDNRFGWGLRFGFGGSYEINSNVSVYAHLGYLTTTSYGDDLTLSADSIPMAIGLRATY